MKNTVQRLLRKLLVVGVAVACASLGYAVHSATVRGASASQSSHSAATRITVRDLLLAATTATTGSIHLAFAGVTTGTENPTHSNDISIKSFSMGVSRPTALGPSGPIASKANVSDVSLSALTDSHTLPLLQQALTASAPASSATLYFTNLSGTTPFDYLTISLGQAAVTSLQLSSAGTTPTEQISISCLTMTFTYLATGTSTPQTLTYNLYTGT